MGIKSSQETNIIREILRSLNFHVAKVDFLWLLPEHV